MINKNKIEENMLGGATNKTTVNIRKDDLGDAEITSNIKKLGNDVSINVVGEDIIPKKTITDRQLSRLAQQAGNFGEDVKDELFSLMAYGNKIPLDMVKKTLANYDLTLKDLKGQDATFRPSAEFAHLFNSSLKEEDAVIEPQDQATIKYLSNVKDANTGKVSQPFDIEGKKYQMVRGIDPSKQIVMAVFCHDDMNDAGENMIHSIEEFESRIAKPMLEKETIPTTKESDDSDTYEGFKHYLVNKQTNEVRKFKTIEEMLSCNKKEDEFYMNTPNFKKYMNERLFGSSKRKMDVLNEVTPTGEETDEEMNIKAKKLMDMIVKRIPSNVIDTIKTPIAQREVISAFAEMIGVPRNGLSNLISGLKDISKEPAINENLVITKKNLTESIVGKKVIKTIKVKDVK
jgi:hypothetical protein